MDWQQIVLATIPVILGISVVWFRIELLLKALKEVSDLFTVLVSSFADKKLTDDEVVKIKQEASEALGALKSLIGKK